MKMLEEYLNFAKDITEHTVEAMIKYFIKIMVQVVKEADTEINSYLTKRVKEYIMK